MTLSLTQRTVQKFLKCFWEHQLNTSSQKCWTSNDARTRGSYWGFMSIIETSTKVRAAFLCFHFWMKAWNITSIICSYRTTTHPTALGQSLKGSFPVFLLNLLRNAIDPPQTDWWKPLPALSEVLREISLTDEHTSNPSRALLVLFICHLFILILFFQPRFDLFLPTQSSAAFFSSSLPCTSINGLAIRFLHMRKYVKLPSMHQVGILQDLCGLGTTRLFQLETCSFYWPSRSQVLLILVCRWGFKGKVSGTQQDGREEMWSSE